MELSRINLWCIIENFEQIETASNVAFSLCLIYSDCGCDAEDGRKLERTFCLRVEERKRRPAFIFLFGEGAAASSVVGIGCSTLLHPKDNTEII